MRCWLILLISDHPIQQGIKKEGVRIFVTDEERTRTDGQTEWRILGSWIGYHIKQIGDNFSCVYVRRY